MRWTKDTMILCYKPTILKFYVANSIDSLNEMDRKTATYVFTFQLQILCIRMDQKLRIQIYEIVDLCRFSHGNETSRKLFSL